jgi:hypothetical protein
VSISNAGGVTNKASQTISGKVTTTEAAAGSTVTLFDNGTQIGSATLGAGGAWSTDITLVGDGPHSLVAKDTDAAGNTGASSPVVFNLGAFNTALVQAPNGTLDYLEFAGSNLVSSDQVSPYSSWNIAGEGTFDGQQALISQDPIAAR